MEATCKHGLGLESYDLMSKTRVDRALFDYVYTMTLNNNSSNPVSNVLVELLDASDNISIFEANVTFAYIGAGESVTSEDTFTLRVDRSVPIDGTIISWRVTIDWEGGGTSSQEMFRTRTTLSEPITGDITGEGRVDVDMDDLARMANNWLQSDSALLKTCKNCHSERSAAK